MEWKAAKQIIKKLFDFAGRHYNQRVPRWGLTCVLVPGLAMAYEMGRAPTAHGRKTISASVRPGRRLGAGGVGAPRGAVAGGVLLVRRESLSLRTRAGSPLVARRDAPPPKCRHHHNPPTSLCRWRGPRRRHLMHGRAPGLRPRPTGAPPDTAPVSSYGQPAMPASAATTASASAPMARSSARVSSTGPTSAGASQSAALHAAQRGASTSPPLALPEGR